MYIHHAKQCGRVLGAAVSSYGGGIGHYTNVASAIRLTSNSGHVLASECSVLRKTSWNFTELARARARQQVIFIILLSVLIINKIAKVLYK